MRNYLTLVLLCLLQSGCGFKPAYSSYNQQILSAIEINPIQTIEGTYYYNHLKSFFPRSSNSKYLLNTTLSFHTSYNIIQPNSDIFRETKYITVTYQLIDKLSLAVVTQGVFKKMNSYSVNFSLYSNYLLKQDSMNLLAQDAAEEVRNRLLMFLSK